MTGISVTGKHEKRLYANHLFAVSYGSFLGRHYAQDPPNIEILIFL
jgi:hypothetical protein